MVRECLQGLGVTVALGPAAGCSLALDFSDDAIPIDAQPDAPYTDEQCAYMEPNNSSAEAVAITPADTGPAAICDEAPEDHDFYKFTVPAATASVTVKINFTNRAGGDLDLKVLDAAGVMLAQSRGFLDGETIVCPGLAPRCDALPPGDYLFEVFPALVGAVNSYDISLMIAPM
ncbi:MAG: PPC domain-containing protein [Deltaproteobacteria bacterium]|nr:PPC domain-containing protein [Deltaproteobacteria bacterium]